MAAVPCYGARVVDLPGARLPLCRGRRASPPHGGTTMRLSGLPQEADLHSSVCSSHPARLILSAVEGPTTPPPQPNLCLSLLLHLRSDRNDPHRGAVRCVRAPSGGNELYWTLNAVPGCLEFGSQLPVEEVLHIPPPQWQACYSELDGQSGQLWQHWHVTSGYFRTAQIVIKNQHHVRSAVRVRSTISIMHGGMKTARKTAAGLSPRPPSAIKSYSAVQCSTGRYGGS